MIKRINKSKTLAKHLVSVDASLIENVTQDKNRTMISVTVNLKNEFKKLIKHHACEEDYA